MLRLLKIEKFQHSEYIDKILINKVVLNDNQLFPVELLQHPKQRGPENVAPLIGYLQVIHPLWVDLEMKLPENESSLQQHYRYQQDTLTVDLRIFHRT